MTKTISGIVFLIALSFSGTASAATVNIGSHPGLYDLSPLVTKINNTASISLDGTLAAHTRVVFTYALTSLGGTDSYGPANLYGQGNYNFYQNNAGNVVYTLTEGYNNYYYGTAFKVAIQGLEASGPDSGVYGNLSYLNSYKSLLLLTSAANITPDGRGGTFSLNNTSNAVATYFTQFSSTVGGLQGASYTYHVAPLSTVPLPAALPLFGGAMLMLGTFRFKRKKS